MIQSIDLQLVLTAENGDHIHEGCISHIIRRLWEQQWRSNMGSRLSDDFENQINSLLSNLFISRWNLNLNKIITIIIQNLNHFRNIALTFLFPLPIPIINLLLILKVEKQYHKYELFWIVYELYFYLVIHIFLDSKSIDVKLRHCSR